MPEKLEKTQPKSGGFSFKMAPGCATLTSRAVDASLSRPR